MRIGRHLAIALVAAAGIPLVAWAQDDEYDDEELDDGWDIELSEQAVAALEESEASLRASPQMSMEHGGAVSYLYGAGQPTLVCSPLKVCKIALQTGETLLPGGVHIGDSTRWQINPLLGANGQSFLIIKPIDAGLMTNLAIHTDVRDYSISLVSHPDRYMPAISFRYPQASPTVGPPPAAATADAAWTGYYADAARLRDRTRVAEEIVDTPETSDAPKPILDPSRLDFRYDVDPCRRCDRFEPKQVFNDGVSTWIVLPDGYTGDLPTFTVAVGRKTSPVQYRWHDGERLQVEAVFEEGLLTLGRKKVKIAWLGATP